MSEKETKEAVFIRLYTNILYRLYKVSVCDGKEDKDLYEQYVPSTELSVCCGGRECGRTWST